MNNSDDHPTAVVLPTTSVAVLVSRSTGGKHSHVHAATAHLAVAARIPRKRTHADDPIEFTLQHWSFLDDKRRFSHLDSLLTRLAPLESIHVACTESAEINTREGSSAKSSMAATRRAKSVEDLLLKLSGMIQSRTDIGSTDDEDACQVYGTLPPIVNDTSRVDSTMVHLLGGEASEAYLAYRGDARLSEQPVLKKVLGFLLHTQDLLKNASPSTEGSYQVLGGVLNSHLALDRTASECINLLPPRDAGYVGGHATNNSLFGVLNKCLTKMGSRTLEAWLRQPLVNLEEILKRQSAVAALVENGVERDRLRDEGLAGFAGLDLDALGGRLTGNRDDVVGSTSSALECLYRIYVLADQQVPSLTAALQDFLPNGGDDASRTQQDECALQYALTGLERVLVDLGKAKQLVEAVLDMDQAPRNFMIQASHDERLDEIKQDLDGVDAELETCHQEMNETWAEVSGQQVRSDKHPTVRLETVGESSCEWQFRLCNTNDQKILQSRLGDTVTVHRLLKNGVYFSTKELRQLGTKKQDLMVEYDKIQRDIVVNAMKIAATYVPVIERVSSLVSELDVLASLAYVAAYSQNGYCKPEMTDSEEDGMGIELKDARHPCVELQNSVDFIPNDISLVFGESSFLLVTGPNMGGKSTYIRSLGAIVTMAQIGSYVPCTSAKINIVHHILARVGAGDLQDRGISTFMAEMLESSSILRTATKRSLIVIDELGRGTSTFDGFGLATAISEYIIKRVGCMTVFATHFHELTALEERETSVKNCHVTAQRASDGSNGLTFLYEVRPGPCLESFGIQVAEMAHVPKAVIADAKRKAQQLENFDYRKKLKGSEQGDGSGNEDFNAEKISSAMEFANRFRKLPLNTMSDEEKRVALTSLVL